MQTVLHLLDRFISLHRYSDQYTAMHRYRTIIIIIIITIITIIMKSIHLVPISPHHQLHRLAHHVLHPSLQRRGPTYIA
jgi:hypothetical protein